MIFQGNSPTGIVRILSEFRDEKIFEIKGKKIEIIDLERLKIINQRG